MEVKRFERVFLLFTREDEIINGGQSPSGYVKLETLDNKIKLSTSIQGLWQAQNDEFTLFLFSDNLGQVRFFNAGSLTIRNSKCDMTRDILLDGSITNSEPFKNVGGAVLVKANIQQGIQSFSCPLVAFKNNKRISYKNELTKFLQDQEEKRKEVLQSEQKKVPTDYEAAEHRNFKQEEPDDLVILENTAGRSDNETLSYEEASQGNVFEKTASEASEQPICNDDSSNRLGENVTKAAHETTDFGEFQNMLRQFGLSGVEGGNGVCMEPMTQAQKEMCENCNKRSIEDTDKNMQVNAAKLKALFNKYFEPYDPFRIRRTDYKWWKVGSPVQLNNLLYQNNIKTPLLFNPQLMMAHFKYKHILAGIYISRRRGKEYVVCGVPAVYNIDEKPYGDFCRWAQLESVRPRHGAFGYWLVYIDIKTGNFLSL